jgi:DNA-directed RNA polymerase sigma subunit (sigma70/sigma32)
MRRNIVSIIRYQKILAMRQEGKTFQEIADELGVTRQRIHQIYSRVQRRISRTLGIAPQSRQTKAA